MTRVLAVDYGSRRIGLAVGDTITGVATPLATESATGTARGDARQVASAAVEYAAGRIVVGLPLNMDGTEGDQAMLTRAFGAVLAGETGLPVTYVDERLSSRGADELLRQGDLSRGKRKKRRDSVAAMVILQTFLDASDHQAGFEDQPVKPDENSTT
ncbi:MAG: Holliday junction resolvase RuvX [Planctomycetota bacterium]|jgi:putative Holliday junction resolvase